MQCVTMPWADRQIGRQMDGRMDRTDRTDSKDRLDKNGRTGTEGQTNRADLQTDQRPDRQQRTEQRGARTSNKELRSSTDTQLSVSPWLGAREGKGAQIHWMRSELSRERRGESSTNFKKSNPNPALRCDGYGKRINREQGQRRGRSKLLPLSTSELNDKEPD